MKREMRERERETNGCEIYLMAKEEEFDGKKCITNE